MASSIALLILPLLAVALAGANACCRTLCHASLWLLRPGHKSGVRDCLHTWAGLDSREGGQVPGTLLQARHQQLRQPVAAGSLICAGLAQHDAHVDEAQLRLGWPCAGMEG